MSNIIIPRSDALLMVDAMAHASGFTKAVANHFKGRGWDELAEEGERYAAALEATGKILSAHMDEQNAAELAGKGGMR